MKWEASMTCDVTLSESATALSLLLLYRVLMEKIATNRDNIWAEFAENVTNLQLLQTSKHGKHRLRFCDSAAGRKRGQPRFCRERDLGHYELEAMNWAEAGKQRKAKKGRRNHDKDTGMFAFTFLTITSFPATHGISKSSSCTCLNTLKGKMICNRCRYPSLTLSCDDICSCVHLWKICSCWKYCHETNKDRSCDTIDAAAFDRYLNSKQGHADDMQVA